MLIGHRWSPLASGPRRSRIVAATLAVLAGVLIGAGCTPSARVATLSVSPAETLLDEPVAVLGQQFPPEAYVDLTLSATDQRGTRWESRATFRSSADGTIDPARTAPTDGSYREVDAMGLLEGLLPIGRSNVGLVYDTAPTTFTLTARSGEAAASTSFTRRLTRTPDDVRWQRLARREAGFEGLFAAPSSGGRRPAVLLIGGSDGKNSWPPTEIAFANHGIAALSVAYFGLPGLPATLRDIPLEYFERALTWLARQPGVDPEQVWIAGVSRGSEAAALLGTLRPDLVSGLIAGVPNNTVLGAEGGYAGAAWTWRGEALPFTRLMYGTDPRDEPRAVIPVERIDGPVLLICGGADGVWPSCPKAEQIQERLAASRFAHPYRLLAYPDAGHGVGALLPYRPVVNQGPRNAGTTLLATAKARADAWPRVTAFIRDRG